MIVDIDGAAVYAGWPPADRARAPVVVLLHVWRWITAYGLPHALFVHRECAVLAVDLPGHGRSGAHRSRAWWHGRLARAFTRCARRSGDRVGRA